MCKKFNLKIKESYKYITPPQQNNIWQCGYRMILNIFFMIKLYKKKNLDRKNFNYDNDSLLEDLQFFLLESACEKSKTFRVYPEIREYLDKKIKNRKANFEKFLKNPLFQSLVIITPQNQTNGKKI